MRLPTRSNRRRTIWIWNNWNNPMRTLVLILLLSVWGMARGMAQSSFRGTVHDASGRPLTGANVVLYSADGKILAYTSVDKEGCFSLKRLSDAERLTVSFISYQTVSVPVEEFKDGQDVVLAESAFQLREVVAKPERILLRGQLQAGARPLHCRCHRQDAWTGGEAQRQH